MKLIIDIKFGDWIIVDSKLRRCCKYREQKICGFTRKERYKFWKSIKIKEKKVVFLGTRTLMNGFTNYDFDYGYYFEHEEAIKAALVCENSRNNPFYVLYENIIRKA